MRVNLLNFQVFISCQAPITNDVKVIVKDNLWKLWQQHLTKISRLKQQWKPSYDEIVVTFKDNKISIFTHLTITQKDEDTTNPVNNELINIFKAFCAALQPTTKKSIMKTDRAFISFCNGSKPIEINLLK